MTSSSDQLSDVPLQLGMVTIHPKRNTIEKAGSSVNMKPKSMSVLLCLLKRPRSVMSRTEIFQDVWGDVDLSDEVLTQAIAELRRALDDDPRRPEFIQTIPRQGYRLLQAARNVDNTDVENMPSNVTALTALPPHRSQLVGRHQEISRLLEHLDLADNGHGSLVFISGEAGIGKTRLAEEFLTLARQRECLVISGRCSENGSVLPFLPFMEIVERLSRKIPKMTLRELLGDDAAELAYAFPELRRFFPDLGKRIELPPELRRRYLFNSFLAFVRRVGRMQTLCLLLDDLQWADESTIALLQHLAGELDSLPLVVISTFRNSELTQSEAFLDALEYLTSHRHAEVHNLKPLPESEVSALLEGLSNSTPPGNWLTIFHQRTDGNPFFVEEFYYHLRDNGRALDRRGNWYNEASLTSVELPTTIALIVQRRVSSLSQQLRKVLDICAVAGRRFDFRMLESAADLQRPDLIRVFDEAELNGILCPVSTEQLDRNSSLSYGFVHDLVRQTLLASMSEARKRHLHLLIADSMRRVYAESDVHVIDIAHHFVCAGDIAPPMVAIRHAKLGGERSIELAAGEDALRFAEYGLDLTDEHDAPQRAKLLYLQAVALRTLMRWEEAMAIWNEALQIAVRSNDSSLIHKISMNMATVFMWKALGREAIEISQCALDIQGNEAHAARIELLCARAVGETLVRDLDCAIVTVRTAQDVAELLDDKAVSASAAMYRGVTEFNSFELDAAMEFLGLAVTPLRDAGSLWDLAPTLGLLGACRVARGEWAKSAKLATETLEAAAMVGHVGALEWGQATISHTELGRSGDIDSFERKARAGIENAQGNELFVFFNSLHLAQVCLWRGQLDQGLAWCDKALAVEPLSWKGCSWAMAVKILAYRGDRSRMAEYDNYSDYLPIAGQRNILSAWKMLAALTEALAILDELNLVADHYPLISELTDKTSAAFIPWEPICLRQLAGILATANHLWSDAEYHFEEALKVTEELPHKVLHPEAQHWYAWMLRTRGRPQDQPRANDFLARSRNGYDQLEIAFHGQSADRMRLA